MTERGDESAEREEGRVQTERGEGGRKEEATEKREREREGEQWCLWVQRCCREKRGVHRVGGGVQWREEEEGVACVRGLQRALGEAKALREMKRDGRGGSA